MVAETANTRSPQNRLDPIREAEAVARLVESLGALTEDDEDLLQDSIEGETSLIEAVGTIHGQIDEDQILIAGIKTRETELSERRKRIENRVKARRAVIEQALSVAELVKLELPVVTLYLRTGSPSVVIEDEAAIPSQFFETKVVLSKSAIGKALKDGEAVTGASLSNAAPSLTIRRK